MDDLEQAKKKIKELQDYLGPRINYSTEYWPYDKVDKWLLEYLILLKENYYHKRFIKNMWKKFWGRWKWD